MRHRWTFIFFYFNKSILKKRKLCNAPSGSIGVDDTEIIFHSSFGNPCPCHSLPQNYVSLIRMPSLETFTNQNTDSHHFLGKPSSMAFRVEHSKHQKVSISQILLQKCPSHESSHRWEREKTQRSWRRLPSCPESLAHCLISPPPLRLVRTTTIVSCSIVTLFSQYIRL